MTAHPGLAYAARLVLLVAVPILVVVAPVSRELAGGATASAHAASARGGKGKRSPKDFEYTVSDCQGAGTLDSIRLEVAEGSLAFGQILTMNCIAATRPNTVRLAYAKKGRELEVSIILRSDVLSDCTCPIGIEGRIIGLGKGAYRISFVFDHKPENSPNEKPTRQTLATRELSIP